MTVQREPTHRLIRELQVLRLSDPLAAAILEVEIAGRTGTIDTGNRVPSEALLYANPSAII